MALTRSTFYDASPTMLPDNGILARIGTICDEFECYGYRRTPLASDPMQARLAGNVIFAAGMPVGICATDAWPGIRGNASDWPTDTVCANAASGSNGASRLSIKLSAAIGWWAKRRIMARTNLQVLRLPSRRKADFGGTSYGAQEVTGRSGGPVATEPKVRFSHHRRCFGDRVVAGVRRARSGRAK